MFRFAFALCLIVALFGISNAETIYVNETGWWLENCEFNPSPTPIQSAVNNASCGDILLLKDGIYVENVVIFKSIELRSENGSENCIVLADESSKDVFRIEDTENVTICGITVMGSRRAGIRIFNSSNCTITNCHLAENYNGVYLRGTKNEPSKFNRVFGCEIVNNYIGVKLSGSGCTENTLRFNAISENHYGLYFTYADSNVISNNDIVDNTIGVYLKSNSEANSIRYNNIANFEWNVYNDQPKEVDARYNYWYLHTNDSIDNTIYDDEEGKGKVQFYPFLENPAPIFEISTAVLIIAGLLLMRKRF